MAIGLKSLLVNSIIVGAVVGGGVALAHSLGAMAPPSPAVTPHYVGKTALPAPQSTGTGKPAATLSPAEHRKIVNWFNRYDRIRLDAQMLPSEKSNAHQMFIALIAGSDSDKAQSKALLSKMIARYNRALVELHALPKIPQTSKLQNGYTRYFATAKAFFERWLKAINANQPQDAIGDLQNGKSQLGLLDVTNKALDKNLRKQYNIAPFPGS